MMIRKDNNSAVITTTTTTTSWSIMKVVDVDCKYVRTV